MPARIVARIGNWACWPSYRPNESRDDQLRCGDWRHKLSMCGAAPWVVWNSEQNRPLYIISASRLSWLWSPTCCNSRCRLSFKALSRGGRCFNWTGSAHRGHFSVRSQYSIYFLNTEKTVTVRLPSSIGVARGCNGCTCIPKGGEKSGAKFTGESCKCTRPGGECTPEAEQESYFLRKLEEIGRSGRWERSILGSFRVCFKGDD